MGLIADPTGPARVVPISSSQSMSPARQSTLRESGEGRRRCLGVAASVGLSNGAEGRVMVGVGGEDDERMCNVRGDSGTGSRCASQCDEGEMAGTDGEGEGGLMCNTGIDVERGGGLTSMGGVEDDRGEGGSM